jgi:hypothetical protein
MSIQMTTKKQHKNLTYQYWKNIFKLHISLKHILTENTWMVNIPGNLHYLKHDFKILTINKISIVLLLIMSHYASALLYDDLHFTRFN